MRCRKCHKLGHAKVICKEKGPKHLNNEEEQLFVATWFASKSWLIDGNCSNHITHNKETYRQLDKSAIS